MIVPVMANSNLVLTRQIYSEETNGAYAHYREPVPLSPHKLVKKNTPMLTRTQQLPTFQTTAIHSYPDRTGLHRCYYHFLLSLLT